MSGKNCQLIFFFYVKCTNRKAKVYITLFRGKFFFFLGGGGGKFAIVFKLGFFS